PHEFSRPVEVLQLSAQGRSYDIAADAAERKLVAQRLAVLDLPKLGASFVVKPLGAGAVEVSGRFAADVVQQCVVSLEPLPVSVSQDVLVTFSREIDVDGEGAELELSPDEDTPEIIVDGQVDLGEIAVEQLALHLDPYPRAPGARFEPVAVGAAIPDSATVSPFAALAKLKTGGKNK
ncbi:MAG: DUF177 domain-containing protein, partial [Rhodospirillaceae bacterium]|nr:DUF177 domain-containing protein [Rhodospirillaceae bacterium]